MNKSFLDNTKNLWRKYSIFHAIYVLRNKTVEQSDSLVGVDPVISARFQRN
jgi:hypothetical protein